MSSLCRHGAVHKLNHEGMATNLLEIDDASYRKFLKPTADISQLFYYFSPESRLQRSWKEQVEFVVAKLRADPALAVKVRIFIQKAGLQANEDAFRNEQYHM